MPYQFYKLMHLIGIILVFSGLCGLLGTYNSGQTPSRGWRIGLAIVHGLGMALALVGGFGLLARLGIITGWPGWVWVKLVIWFCLGGSIFFAKRKAHLRMNLIALWAMFGGTAAYMAIYKPF